MLLMVIREGARGAARKEARLRVKEITHTYTKPLSQEGVLKTSDHSAELLKVV
jgi:hypothetical protein